MALQHLRSSTANKRPTPAAMSDGQLAMNTNLASPGLFLKDSNGDLVKVGPVHVGTTAPNATPASGGQAGNSVGEQWLDTSSSRYVFKIWDGTAWRTEDGEFVNSSGDTMTGALVMDNQQQVRFRETTANGTNFIAIQAPASVASDRTLTLPDVTGTIVSTGDTGTVTSTMILDGTILNADVNASAAIAGTKISPDFGSQTIATTGVFSHALGAAATPSITFTGDLNTGVYSPGADQVAVATNGTQRLTVDTAATTSTLPVVHPLGAVGTPSLTFTGDLNTGIWSPAADTIAFSEGGVEAMRIDSSGRVGIGTSAPAVTLDVANIHGLNNSITRPFRIRNYGQLSATGYGVGMSFFYPNGTTSDLGFEAASIDSSYTAGGNFGNLIFSTNNNTGVAERLRITSAGNVGIGTTSPAQALEVNGNIQVGDTASSAARIDFGSASTRIQHDGADNLSVFSNGSERARIDSSGRLLVGTSTARGVGTSTNGLAQLETTSYVALSAVNNTNDTGGSNIVLGKSRGTTAGSVNIVQSGDNLGTILFAGADGTDLETQAASIVCAVDGTPGANDMPGRLVFSTTADGASSPTERMRIRSDGTISMGPSAGSGTAPNNATGSGYGAAWVASVGTLDVAVSNVQVAIFNRPGSDGTIISLRQDATEEGSISVSGTTVSYNGAHLSRWSQLPSGAERTEILRGTVLSNIDEMCEWGDEDNEQLNRMKLSDVEGDKNVSGVFQAWDDDDDTYTNDFYCAMTGDFIIRIGAGTTVERGDLLMSAGDGTAKPQDDDIIRSKTIAKVTSTNVSCTYDDGSYCVPCVLMAC